MTEPTPPSNPPSMQAPLHERLRAVLRPGHRWFPALVFALALTFGLLVSLLWMETRQAPSARIAVDPTATPDPTHPPLPAPMAGDLSGLPAAMPTAPNAAYIEPEPRAQPDTNDATPNPPPTAQVPDAGAPASGDSEAQIIGRTQPDYPIEALRSHEEGQVRLQIALDALGNIQDVRIVRSSDSRALDRAAMDAARQWRFRPRMHDGQPIMGMIEVPVDFHLDEEH